MLDLPPASPNDEILVTASLEAISEDEVSQASTQLDEETLDRLGEARIAPLLHLLPSTSLAETGPPGTQAQVRIRGAEASHTLLFIDGIKANDPAAGNQARFELLTAPLADSIELTRGPQSALWGSEAIGGVLALRSSRTAGQSAAIEAGSDDFLLGQTRLVLGDAESGLTFGLGAQRSSGFDSFGETGEHDGYDNLTARFSGSHALSHHWRFDASGFAVRAHSEFDGFDPITFLRADTRDESHSDLAAGRLAANFSSASWSAEAGATALVSRNVNWLADAELNRTSAERLSYDAKVSRRFSALGLDQRFTLAVDHEAEDFSANDEAYGGLTAQDVERDRTGIVAEWRATNQTGLSLGLALRHDMFDGFDDASSLSAGLRIPLGRQFALAANYGEGIAQPSFFDLYGFFPGSFVGNPSLRPERSHGFEIGVRHSGQFEFSATYFKQDLTDEIVDVFDPVTFLSTTENGVGNSRRRGIEVEASYPVSRQLSLSANYSWLDATGPETEGARLTETRRPRHRAAMWLVGSMDEFTYGASLAIVGDRYDTDFDLFPAQRVKLGAYSVASARLAYALNDKLEVSLRGSNLFDADYQDVVGYNTAGRTVFVGLRFTP